MAKVRESKSLGVKKCKVIKRFKAQIDKSVRPVEREIFYCAEGNGDILEKIATTEL